MNSILKKSCVALGVALLASPAFALAPLAPGGQLFNPDLGMGTPYTIGLPAWAVPASQAAPTLVSPMSLDFTGTVTSNVYFLNGVDETGGLGFSYMFSVAAPPDAGMVRASFADDWGGVNFIDSGSDESGSSSTPSPAGVTNWNDGDPHFIERTGAGSPAIQWRFGSNGTQLDGGDFSAVVWWETDAMDWSISAVSMLDSNKIGSALVYAVPVPGAAVLGLMGLGIAGYIKRRMA